MMLGFFKNNNENVQDENFNPDDIKTHYEGGVLYAKYITLLCHGKSKV